MTILEETFQNVKLSSMYRFEGHSSHCYYNLNDLFIPFDIKEIGYIYFSKTLDHHAYFVSKRILQFISQEILKNTDFNLEQSCLLNIDNYHAILKLIEDYNQEMPLTSLEFQTCPIWLSLIKQNTVSGGNKNGQGLILEADKHIKNGGYAFCKEWLQLFHLLTIAYSYQAILKEDVIRFFKAYRLNTINSLYPLNFSTSIFNDYHRQLFLNPTLDNDFSKYAIINAMESLIANNKVNPKSKLGMEPTQVIKSTINQYERIRRKTKTTLETIMKRDFEV